MKTVSPLWMILFLVALVYCYLSGYIGVIYPSVTLVGVLFFTLAVWGSQPLLRLLALPLGSVLLYMVLIHAIPGFFNFNYAKEQVISPGAAPYNLWINFDKPLAALAIVAVTGIEMKPVIRLKPILFLTFIALLATVGFAFAVGLVNLHPKWPSWGWIWVAKMFFITVFSEQVFFRIFLQDGLKKVGVPEFTTPLIASICFAAVHLYAGVPYAIASLIAGLAHAYSYHWTKNLLVPMSIHMAVNTVHITLFTYPILK